MKKTPTVLVDEVKTEENIIQQFETLRLSMIMRMYKSIKLINHSFLNGTKNKKRYSNVQLLSIVNI